jgi:gag-polypeptide of LTR copia-type
VKECDSVREVINELDATFLNLDIQKQLTQKKEYQDFRFSEESVITQFIKYESRFNRCIELGVTISVAEKKKFLVKSLPTKLQQHLINIGFMIDGTITVKNLTYTQIKEMMIQRWEFMEALRLNEKDNKGKGKVVEEKKESGMKTALNAFKRGGRVEIEVKEVEEEEELEQTQPKHPTLLNPNYNHH